MHNIATLFAAARLSMPFFMFTIPLKALALMLTLGLALAQNTASADETWPQDHRVAISLNYDDALNSQLDNALPALNRFNHKASFYLTLSSPVVAQRIAEWRALAAEGHELGNHTLFHHCRASLAERDWVAPHQDLDQRSPEQLRDEIITANHFLTAIDGRRQRTFTPPCGDTQAGGKDFLPLIRPHLLAIKGQEPKYLNAVWLSPTNVDGAALITLVQQHAQGSLLINLTFHGVGGDYLSISSEAHEQLLRYLAAHPDKFYVATYQELARGF
ncbi:polysaccharide deacetylase family protein [Simiduia aestuariiviva]|uniref:Peptidoglycan/xylan/chitin deacetylase (PgdA/CDA1 family) n=1 Tax=Simiduia aestuariiviva TaxID=1510459 RepID=A0A839USV2_9GAMM|nr:polysaccharide deacetylase family protein [Simiduia aestuariiviva]MBB3169016.1 peptidoglycan/xylan/chitin deacetylase (PgdA/CDA1 family) [Simiduia aestuariiviva]